MNKMAKKTIEIKGSELPEKLRGDMVRADMLVRVTIEVIGEKAREKMQASELIGAAKRLGEAPSDNGQMVEQNLRDLRDEWQR